MKPSSQTPTGLVSLSLVVTVGQQSQTSSVYSSFLYPANLCALCSPLFLQDKRAAKALRTEMKAADTNQDGMISFIEFLGYFQKMARYQADLARTQRLESYGRPRELPHCEFCPALPCCALTCPALPCPSFSP